MNSHGIMQVLPPAVEEHPFRVGDLVYFGKKNSKQKKHSVTWVVTDLFTVADRKGRPYFSVALKADAQKERVRHFVNVELLVKKVKAK